MSKPRLAIGDVYLVSAQIEGERIDYAFEICGEAWINDERHVIGVCRDPPGDESPLVLMFNSRGKCPDYLGYHFWTCYLSRRKPRFQRPAR